MHQVNHDYLVQKLHAKKIIIIYTLTTRNKDEIRLEQNILFSLIEFFSLVCFQILVVFRNPKDTLVSYYHFMNKNPVLPSAEPWDKFFSDFMAGEGAKHSIMKVKH